MSMDARRIVAAQGIRAAGYGFTAVLLGALLAARDYTPLRAGVVLGALVAGTAGASLLVGAVADRVGRRRCYVVLFLGLAVAGAAVGAGAAFWVLLVVALTGLLSTDVVDNGPATTLEQTMLANEDTAAAGKAGARVYGFYNAVASLCGAAGALAATVPGRLGTSPASAWPFLVLVPVGLAGAVLAAQLSPAVEADRGGGAPSGPEAATRGWSRLGPSRSQVRRLATLFAVDAAGGGLVTASFLAYYLTERYDVPVGQLGALFFATSLLQSASVWLAPRLADRVGLVPTMVGTHLPSNVLLASVAFAPTFPVAVALLLARTSLSQMDVPTRQALVMSVVEPSERTAAAAVTNAARYTVRPFGPLVGGLLQQVALGLPLLLAGVVKGGYDVALWRWSGRLPRDNTPTRPVSPPRSGGDTRAGSVVQVHGRRPGHPGGGHPQVCDDTDGRGEDGGGGERGGEPVDDSGRVGEAPGGGRDRGQDGDT
jgi:MFS family permease